MLGSSLVKTAAGGVSSPRGAAAEQPVHASFSRQQLLVLCLFTILAAALRLYKLGEWSVWVDEAHTYRDVVSTGESFWGSEVRNYPLSYLLLRGLLALGMPSSEGWLRLPFAFFGILSIPALGLLGRSLVGPRAALVAALLLAVSPWHIFWSQNARSYSMVLFFALLAAAGFYGGMQPRSAPMVLTALGLTLVAGLCHPSAYILLSGLLAYGFWANRRRATELSTLQKWLPALILVLLVILTWVLLPLIEHVRSVKPDFSLFHLIQTLVFFVRTPLLVAALGGALLLLDRGHRAGSFLLCWVVVPLLVLAVLASVVQKVNAQYAFYTLPGFCLLAAVVVLALAERIRVAGFRGHLLRVVPLGILLFDMAGHTYLYFQKYYGERPRWREARDYILAQPGPDKRVLTTNGPSMKYYLQPSRLSTDTRETGIEIWPIGEDVFEHAGGVQFLQDQVAVARERGLQLFVVWTEPELNEWDRGGITDSYVRRHFFQRRRYPNWTGPKDMTVLVYELPPP